MVRLWFEKWEATGNDFIIFDNRQPWDVDFGKLASRLCDRRRGVGADGILLVERPKGEGDFLMRVINADGTEAEMSGNGIRCAVGWWIDNTAEQSTKVKVETLAGLKEVEVSGREGDRVFLRVLMGSATLKGKRKVELAGKEIEFYEVDVGNPHLVFISDTFDGELFEEAGAKLSRNWNIEFFYEGKRVRVWERGVGETMACGTGATAVFCVLALERGVDEAELEFPGGTLKLKSVGKEGKKVSAVLEGYARKVFSGYLDV